MKITPDSKQIQTLAKEYSVVPICRELFADITTPISILKNLARESSLYFLLESVEGQEKRGRYSFLGCDPVMRVFCRDQEVTILPMEHGVCQNPHHVHTSRPFDVLRDILKSFRAPKLSQLPPFTGGFVGYFAYSMIGYWEPSLTIKKGSAMDFDLMLFDTVIAYDHLTQKIFLIVNMKTDHVLENYGKACAKLEKLSRLIMEAPKETQLPVYPNVQFACDVSKEEYCQMVEKAKKYIQNGDIFQAVISRQFKSPYPGSLLNAYRMLRTTNPSPYMVYLHIDNLEIMSTSPETLVRLNEGKLTTFPVAGSRPRGSDEQEDLALEKELLSDEKELAEHNMLVDLGRNDLGKISQFSTVQVTKYKMIHRYSKIMHLCSQVESQIREGEDAFSAIEAVLPAGTLSGAPKIRACQIIEELEPDPRGIYGGALGYIDFTGNMDTCIAIRMAVKENNQVYVQAGGGIVADSIPEKEYEESANKAKAVIQAIEQMREVTEE